jgi:hypothetical protein
MVHPFRRFRSYRDEALWTAVVSTIKLPDEKPAPAPKPQTPR